MLLFGIFWTIWVFWAFYTVLLQIRFVIIYTLFRVKLCWLKPCSCTNVVFLHFCSSQPTPQEWMDCIFTLVLYCETFAESSDNQLYSANSTFPRYHRALCLGTRDDRIRLTSQASNVKKLTCFIVASWIVGSDKGHDSAIRSVGLFCHKMSTSATLCQDMFGNIATHNIFSKFMPANKCFTNCESCKAVSAKRKKEY